MRVLLLVAGAISAVSAMEWRTCEAFVDHKKYAHEVAQHLGRLPVPESAVEFLEVFRDEAQPIMLAQVPKILDDLRSEGTKLRSAKRVHAVVNKGPDGVWHRLVKAQKAWEVCINQDLADAMNSLEQKKNELAKKQEELKKQTLQPKDLQLEKRLGDQIQTLITAVGQKQTAFQNKKTECKKAADKVTQQYKDLLDNLNDKSLEQIFGETKAETLNKLRRHHNATKWDVTELQAIISKLLEEDQLTKEEKELRKTSITELRDAERRKESVPFPFEMKNDATNEKLDHVELHNHVEGWAKIRFAQAKKWARSRGLLDKFENMQAGAFRHECDTASESAEALCGSDAVVQLAIVTHMQAKIDDLPKLSNIKNNGWLGQTMKRYYGRYLSNDDNLVRLELRFGCDVDEKAHTLSTWALDSSANLQHVFRLWNWKMEGRGAIAAEKFGARMVRLANQNKQSDPQEWPQIAKKAMLNVGEEETPILSSVATEHIDKVMQLIKGGVQDVKQCKIDSVQGPSGPPKACWCTSPKTKENSTDGTYCGPSEFCAEEKHWFSSSYSCKPRTAEGLPITKDMKTAVDKFLDKVRTSNENDAPDFAPEFKSTVLKGGASFYFEQSSATRDKFWKMFIQKVESAGVGKKLGTDMTFRLRVKELAGPVIFPSVADWARKAEDDLQESVVPWMKVSEEAALPAPIDMYNRHYADNAYAFQHDYFDQAAQCAAQPGPYPYFDLDSQAPQGGHQQQPQNKYYPDLPPNPYADLSGQAPQDVPPQQPSQAPQGGPPLPPGQAPQDVPPQQQNSQSRKRRSTFMRGNKRDVSDTDISVEDWRR